MPRGDGTGHGKRWGSNDRLAVLEWAHLEAWVYCRHVWEALKVLPIGQEGQFYHFRNTFSQWNVNMIVFYCWINVSGILTKMLSEERMQKRKALSMWYMIKGLCEVTWDGHTELDCCLVLVCFQYLASHIAPTIGHQWENLKESEWAASGNMRKRKFQAMGHDGTCL
jgi:hypothetical protein